MAAKEKKTDATAAAPKKPTTRRTTSKAKAGQAQSEVTYEMIAERAYHIALSGEGGSAEDNWHRAEAELKAVQS